MPQPELALLQFPYSHYNEKARWALDWKRIPHARIDYLPGPHEPQIRRLTGQSMVPVLRDGERLLPGSAAIVDELERRFPEPPLYPADPALRERALALQREFDDEVGPRVRRALFAVLVREPDYLAHLFSHRRSWLVRRGYRALMPVARRMILASMQLDDARAVEESVAASFAALERVAAASASTGQLVGDRFTIADLTAAALLAPLVELEHPDMNRPRPIPASLAAFYAQFVDHPGSAWVREQYRRHRPPSCAISG
jgi:glutathione S-transferase